MPLNPNCNQRKLGYAMRPPHIPVSLRDMIYDHTGFVVPDQPMGQVKDDCDDQLVLTL